MRAARRGARWALPLAALWWLAACSQPTARIASAVAGPVTFVDGERLEYVLVEAGETLGHGVLLATSEDGGWRLEQRYSPADGAEVRDASTARVGRRLEPIWSERVIERGGETERYGAAYDIEGARYTSTVAKGGSEQEREFRLEAHAYDNESSLWLWRSLELHEDYEARYVSVNPFERSQQAVDLLVTERMEISVPAGDFDVWRLQVRSGRATGIVWIEVAAPHRVVQWDNGSSLMQLTASSG